MQRLLFLFCACLFTWVAGVEYAVAQPARNHQRVDFVAEYDGQPLRFENGSCFISSDSLNFHTLKFYVSKVELLMNNEVVWKDKDGFYLLDFVSDPETGLVLPFKDDVAYNQIRFNLGVDSATNAGGARGGNLDARHGMYWAWHSGYVNLKVEGASPKCNTRKHEFSFHLGGFRTGENCAQTITLDVRNTWQLKVGFDLAKFFRSIDLRSMNTEMTPGPVLVQLSSKAAQMFYMKQE